jgi:hypothetical protein
VHDKLPLIVTSNKHSYTLLDYRNVDFSFSSRTDIIKLLHLVLYDHFLSTDNFQFVDLGVVYDQTVFIKHLNLVVDFRNQVGFSNIRFLRGRILNGCFGADRVKGWVKHRIKERNGIFLLCKETNGRGLEKNFTKVGELGWGVEVWRITTMAVWGYYEDKNHGFEENNIVGDMFRVKQDNEVKTSATAGIRYRYNRYEEKESYEKHLHEDKLLISLDRNELFIFLMEVENSLKYAGLVFPKEIYDDIGVYFFDRMSYEQRACFIDVLNILKAWGAETQNMAREKGDWTIAERRFMFCFFLHTLSFERYMEFFICYMSYERLSVTSLFFDILGFCFWANLEGSDDELWGEVLETEIGYRFFRRGGLGQFFDWGDGEWERRRRRGADRVAFCIFAERKLTLPAIFVEAKRLWSKTEPRRRKWGKYSLRIRRVDSVSAKMFFKLWDTKKRQGKENYCFFKIMELFDIMFMRFVQKDDNRVFMLFNFQFYFKQFGAEARPWHLFILLNNVTGSRIQYFRWTYRSTSRRALRQEIFGKQHFVKSSNVREVSNFSYSETFDIEAIQCREVSKEQIRMTRQKLLEMRARSGQSVKKKRRPSRNQKKCGTSSLGRGRGGPPPLFSRKSSRWYL